MAAQYGIPLAIGTIGSWIVGAMFSAEPQYTQSQPWFGETQPQSQYTPPPPSEYTPPPPPSQYTPPPSEYTPPPPSEYTPPPPPSEYTPPPPPSESQALIETPETESEYTPPQAPDSEYTPAPESPPQVTPETMRMWPDSQCVEYLGKLNIRDRRAFRMWALKNHPDKGGDAQLFANVSSCADRIDRIFPESPPTSTQDCSNPDVYFENSASGDCLFEAFSQIYYPIDKRDNASDYEKVLDNAKKTRMLLSRVYDFVSSDESLRKQYSIPLQITDKDNRVMSLKTYASHIRRPGIWATDTDLEILSRVLRVPFHVIEHSPQGATIVRDIVAFGTTPAESEYYTMCNIDDRHWVLKKHANPLPPHSSLLAMNDGQIQSA